MSDVVTSLVLKRFARYSDRQRVLLVLADACDDSGSGIHISAITIAYRSCMPEYRVSRALDWLISKGWLETADGDIEPLPGAARRYRINVEKLRGAAKSRRAAQIND